MSAHTASAPDVFSAREIARAARVSMADVQHLIDSGTLATVDGRFVARRHAVTVVRWLRSRDPATPEPGAVFQPLMSGRRSPGRALAASGAIHVGLIAVFGLFAGRSLAPAAAQAQPAELPRLVFVATPGPGGGGGGGGLRQPAPPPRAELQGRAAQRSPVPPPRRVTPARPVERRATPPPPVRPRPVERPVEPPPPALREPLPQVIAPVATIAPDQADRPGLLPDSSSEAASQGPGSGGGVGSGGGNGIGEGAGPGIGPGSGGGTGGGPYRPGSGITPPAIIREVKPEYTQEARRRGVEGDVVLEIIVRANGSVGQVRLLQGLGAGLDQRAIDAIRHWRFSPAHRLGTPVDVVVEVAVEFKLR